MRFQVDFVTNRKFAIVAENRAVWCLHEYEHVRWDR
jgi:hypothetical protein